MSASPGWYPDPGGRPGRFRFRWWNGRDWTNALSDSADRPMPRRARVVAGSSTIGLKAAWTLGVALVAVAGVVLGLVIWHDPSGSSSRAAARTSVPRPSVTGVPGELDQTTHEASIGAATMTLPSEPYKLRTDPMRAPDLFDSYFAAGAIVHEDYQAQEDWSAVVGLGHVAASASRSDVDATATAVADRISSAFFDGQPTTISSPSVAEHAVDGCSGYLFTAEVGYRIPGLASRADDLTVLVVRLDDATLVAAFSSVPTDAPAQVKAQAAGALASLHVQ